jgi:hypothetical protein
MNGGSKEEKKGKMMYSFDATGDGELSAPEGRDVILLEEDGKWKNHDSYIASPGGAAVCGE